MTVDEQVVETLTTENAVEPKVETQETVNPAENKPYRTFQTQEEFDRHSAGILNNAKGKAEKELLAMLGLKPDEKDKLAKFKEAYDATLSESERQARTLDELNVEVKALKGELDERDATIKALSKLGGRSTEDVGRLVKMARGLVDEETSMDMALEQVMSLIGGAAKEEPRKAPVSKPLSEPDVRTEESENPFRTGNLTEQGRMIRNDREKARALYTKAYGKAPCW